MSRYIERFNAFERVLHWTVAIAFFILVFSGLGLYAHTFFGYFDFFGGPRQGILFHKWTGIIFAISSLLLALAHLKELFTFDQDDRLWLKNFGGYLSKEKREIPQGKYNCGQKLFGIFSVAATIGLFATGLVIWEPTLFSRGLTQFSLMAHGLFFTLFMMGAIIHIYLATIGNPGTLDGMLYGKVRKSWAKMHALKWYRKMVKD
ncbi:MAG: formate dehydrogenase subunit gamma [Trichloromonadaceae bacterium]